ncbi:MAG: DnaJ domain-containing protein [Bacteroidales bacterium]|jgi:DnaJ like chaperone protein|nr:TerB family tellurite resistance protein [Bacteroidales bacterium]MCK9498949.1 TerB family tellurite resistance protein [Bacteroidales bacterium]MDY0313468.1 TerB family tellurite resistance protein [Bacteroidales bacterium]NLB86119.1 DnaJ domain-containing protein [Bacteroidales bacterium]
MIKVFKYIGAFIGWIFGGFIGAIIGFMFGSFIDSLSINTAKQETVRTPFRNDFMISFLTLTAAIMKADGLVKKSELEYVKQFLRTNFGVQQTQEALQILKRILNTNIDIDKVCTKVRYGMQHAIKLQIIHYLFGIANADGEIHKNEIYLLEQIAFKIGLSTSDYKSIKSMFIEETDSAYQILGVSKSANEEDLKKAYRTMATKHHPDKVANLGEDVQNAAKQKFQKVNEAWEKIKKERGIK